jgi:protein gp37
MGQANYRNGFGVTAHDHMLEIPLRWHKPRTVFVNSMGDLFHEDVSFSFIRRVFAVMREAHWHTFQVLTKRSRRLASLAKRLSWPSNVWIGVSVENDQYLTRVDDLRSTDAQVKFLSLEPLLGPLSKLCLDGIAWVIVGGESGPGARNMNSAWVSDIRDRCLASGVPFFFKQWGGTRKKQAGRELEGRTWNEVPEPVCSNA